MRVTLWPVVAVTLISTLGNAQDDAAAVPTGGVSAEGVSVGYAAQGNVAMSKAQHEAEIERAALAARQQKALKEAMASYVQKPPPITTAEQFLAANRPPAGPPREHDSGLSPVKTSTYVPEFQSTTSRVNPTGQPSQVSAISSSGAELPGRKPGLFDLFKPKKTAPVFAESTANPYAMDAPAPPSASYEQPAGSGTPAPTGATPVGMTTADQNEAIAAATVAPARAAEKPDFFSRLFGKGKKAESIPPGDAGPVYEGTVPAVPVPPGDPSATVAPVAEPGGIPIPPAFTDGAPAPPAPGPEGEN